MKSEVVAAEEYRKAWRAFQAAYNLRTGAIVRAEEAGREYEEAAVSANDRAVEARLL